MRKVLTLVLAIGVAIAIGSAASASGGEKTCPTSGVHFEHWSPDTGMLSIGGVPGASFGVYDAAGAAVAGGTLATEPVHMPVGGRAGPDGVLFHVVVGDDYHPIKFTVDPNWEWD